MFSDESKFHNLSKVNGLLHFTVWDKYNSMFWRKKVNISFKCYFLFLVWEITGKSDKLIFCGYLLERVKYISDRGMKLNTITQGFLFVPVFGNIEI